MKIENGIKSMTTGVIAEDQPRLAKKKSAESADVKADTSVQLSSQASHLQAIEKGFATTPVVDAARVAEIKQAMSEGKFTVNPDKVVDGLLKTVEELIRAHKA
jgi:negative regulator of flagellin synthesis FlgM